MADQHKGVYVCVHLRARPDFFVRVFSHSSMCAPGIPGHLWKQRPADRWAKENVGTERRLCEKRVWDEGKKKS